MKEKDRLAIMLESEATTITALLDEIEYGENDPKGFVNALRQVSYRLRRASEILAKD